MKRKVDIYGCVNHVKVRVTRVWAGEWKVSVGCVCGQVAGGTRTPVVWEVMVIKGKLVTHGPACCWCLYNWLHCSRTIDHPTGGQETIPSQGGIDTTTHNYQQQILLTAVERFVTGLVRDFFCWFRSESKKWLDALVIGIPLPSIVKEPVAWQIILSSLQW